MYFKLPLCKIVFQGNTMLLLYSILQSYTLSSQGALALFSGDSRGKKMREKRLLSLQFHIFQPPLCTAFHFDTASLMKRDWLSLLLHAQFSVHCDICDDSKYSGLFLPSSSSPNLWDQEGICFPKGSEKCLSVRMLSLNQIHLWQHHKAFQTQGVPKLLSRVTQKCFCLNQNENEKRGRIQTLDLVNMPHPNPKWSGLNSPGWPESNWQFISQFRSYGAV